jgi:hypothetical protein
MKRFRRYLDRPLNTEKVKIAEKLAEFGVAGRYLPDPPEDFDEFEFAADFPAFPNAGFSVAVEKGAVKRIMFGFYDPDNPDVFRPMSENGLEDFLRQHGETLTGFFDFVTSPT